MTMIEAHDYAGCQREPCPPRGVAVGHDVFAAVLGRERTGEPALGQPGVQAPPEAAGATGVGFASRPGGVS